MQFRNYLPVAVSGLAGLLLLGQVACGAPVPLEEIGGNWVRLNGTPNKDDPYMEIGCVVSERESPTLTMYAGSNKPSENALWRVTVGDQSTEDQWRHSPGFPDGSVRTPERPLDFEIFEWMVNSGTDSFTITMEETYTFALSGGVRTQLSERFPEHCYIEMAVPEPMATPTPEPTATPPLPTFTMAPTATPELTATPEPIATLTPTPTPEPTPTPTTVRPTRTLIPTITIAPTLTPVPWETYEHNKDRDQDRSCDTRPNFSVSAPPTWVEGHLRCGSFSFESRDNKAIASVDWKYLPNYDSDPDVAIKQITEDYAETKTTDFTNTVWTTRVSSSEQIEIQGQPALRQIFTVSPASFLWCDQIGYRLIILPKSWSTNVQRAVWLEATNCKGSSQHDDYLRKIVDSLRLIEP